MINHMNWPMFSKRDTTLSYDDEPELGSFMCSECHKTHRRSLGFILQGGKPYAYYVLNIFSHKGKNKPIAAFAVNFFAGKRDGKATSLAFSSALFDGPGGHKFSLVDPMPEMLDDGTTIYLTRKEALTHRLLYQNWQITNFALKNDPHLKKNHKYK